jgi:choline dehydrogenase-like flavoprotein
MGKVDVLVVGSGLMGAIVARRVRDADARAIIAVVDAGPPIGSVLGQHLHDSPDDDLRETYNQRVLSDRLALYVGPEIGSAADDVAAMRPGMYRLSAFGDDPHDLPATALSWNFGGMSVHWTAASPSPWGDEVFDFADPTRRETDLAEAASELRVHPNISGVADSGRSFVRTLEQLYGAGADGRGPQPLPMAVQPAPSGRWPRTGPNTIFPEFDGTDERVRISAGTIVTALHHEDGVVVGATLRDVVTGSEERIEVGAVAVCADALRTPQLLWASGVRPAALGRYLNEHALISGVIAPSLAAMGIEESGLPGLGEGEWRAGAYWLPHDGERQPYNGEITEKYVGGTSAADYVLSFTWYVAADVDAKNRVTFSDDEVDVLGMPRMTVEYAFSDDDRRRFADAIHEMERVGVALGADPSRFDFRPAEPGATLHYTGTVRMGAVDDGTSVCDPGARVWGYDNLWVAGNGVIPTALLCNPTLTAAVSAIRAGDGIARQLAGSPG